MVEMHSSCLWDARCREQIRRRYLRHVVLIPHPTYTDELLPLPGMLSVMAATPTACHTHFTDSCSRLQLLIT